MTGRGGYGGKGSMVVCAKKRRTFSYLRLKTTWANGGMDIELREKCARYGIIVV